MRWKRNFSESVVKTASGPLRTYYLISFASPFGHPNASHLGIPYKQEPAPRNQCSYKEDCIRFFTDMLPVNNGDLKLDSPLNLPTPQNSYPGSARTCVACSASMPSFKEFDCQQERFLNEEAANITKLLQPFAKTLVAELYLQPVLKEPSNPNQSPRPVVIEEAYWSVLVELKKDFEADARWIFPYALRRNFRIIDELKCKCEPKDLFLNTKSYIYGGRNNYPWYLGFQMSRKWP